MEKPHYCEGCGEEDYVCSQRPCSECDCPAIDIRLSITAIVEAWFKERSDSSDAGYSTVGYDDLAYLVDKLMYILEK
jgi:hypothetical protein